jgi:hypothetical protein
MTVLAVIFIETGLDALRFQVVLSGHFVERNWKKTGAMLPRGDHVLTPDAPQ